MFGINLKSEFLRSVVLLTSGTVLAQVIHLGFQPVITRLFDPTEIGELNYFLRFVAFFASVATLRYELSIPLPKSNHHAFQLFRISLKISLILTISVFGFGMIYSLFNGKFNLDALYFTALAVAIFLTVFRNIGLNYAIRMKWFTSISYSKVFGAIGISLFKVGAGVLLLGAPGLILATILGVLSGTGIYIYQFINSIKEPKNSASKIKQYVLAKEHSDFPKVNLPHTLMDAGRELLIAFIFVEYFGKSAFGSYSYGLMIIGIPLLLVGTTIGQAFFQKSSEMFNNKQPIFPLLKKTTIILTILSILPFTLLSFYGQEIFAWIFTEKWQFAGLLVEVISPWMALKFISSPISTIPLVIGKQKFFFYMGILNTTLQLGLLCVLPFYLGYDENGIIESLNIISLIMAFYLLVLVFVKLFLVKKSDVQLEITQDN